MAILALAIFLFSRPPILQPLGYHNFADQRPFFGILNFLDVASNLPFLLIGACGLGFLAGRKCRNAFSVPSERWAFVVFFLGLLLTFFGSSYYHLQPRNARLLWDRLPMTLVFRGILPATIADRISLSAGALMLVPLTVLGSTSVFYWNWTESQGRGDLRPYFLVQFGSMLAIMAILLLFRSRYSHLGFLALAVLAYALAKLLELLDTKVFALGHIVSGHTLKHLAAALTPLFVLLMLVRRRPINTAGDSPRADVLPSSTEPVVSWRR